MTRKDYKLIAQSIKAASEHIPNDEKSMLYVVRAIVSELCFNLKDDNVNFKEDVFKKACGL